MTDPVEYALRLILNLPATFPEEVRGVIVWLEIMVLVGLLGLLLAKNFMNWEGRQEEKKWSDICAALTRRIGILIPVYEVTLAQFTEEMQVITSCPDLVDLADSMPSDIKEVAEMDYCMSDVENLTNEGILQDRLSSILKTDKQGE